MNENETVVTETVEYTESTVPTESEAVEYVHIISDRPFLTTRFDDYTVMEGFQLLNFVLLLCVVLLALFRR